MKAGRAAKGRLAAFFLGVWMLAACTGTARAASGFADVNAGAYYAAAVDWAVSEGITTGTSATAFSPDRTCTQAEILTFLWRANGLPEPVIENPFENVDPSSYYYKAAVWAYENQMISGSTFDADRHCISGMPPEAPHRRGNSRLRTFPPTRTIGRRWSGHWSVRSPTALGAPAPLPPAIPAPVPKSSPSSTGPEMCGRIRRIHREK